MQETLMKFDPATGEARPYPSHAEQWRLYHGFTTAWLFNPWDGDRRSAGAVGTDPLGRAIVPPSEPMRPAPIRVDAAGSGAGGTATDSAKSIAQAAGLIAALQVPQVPQNVPTLPVFAKRAPAPKRAPAKRRR